MPDDEVLDAQQVAQLLRVNYRTVLKLANDEELSSFTVGNQVRFRRSDVEQYIESHRKRKGKKK